MDYMVHGAVKEPRYMRLSSLYLSKTIMVPSYTPSHPSSDDKPYNQTIVYAGKILQYLVKYRVSQYELATLDCDFGQQNPMQR